MIGQTISHYSITAKLGEGGMGVVYRAEDTKLKRPVALKFIAANLIKDAEARKRFEREATAAAGVSHANVCHVYEIADADGHTFLAMEFVDGESLDSRIERGPLPLKDALEIARQTAEGLAAAHAKGVVHRDIKPGNLLVTPTGQVKILDFGLALLTEGSKLTQLDTKVGTVAYMSPEQAQGLEVDHRTDVWALGCVLYEMVSGRRPFLGHYDQALVYSIVNEPPEPLTALRTGVPMEMEFIVGKCLEKDRGSRYQQANEIAVDLRNLQDKLKSGRSTILRGQILSQSMPQPSGVTTQSPAGPLVRYRVIESVEDSAESANYLAEDTQLQRSVSIRVLPQSSAEQIERGQRRKQTGALLAGALGVVLGLVVAAFAWLSPATVHQTPLRRFILPTDGVPDRPAISPDGRYIAFVAGTTTNRMLWVQDLEQSQPRLIFGPDDVADIRPAWSPDSQFIVFRSGDELKRLPVAGGPATTLCAVAGTIYGIVTWTPDGESIVFSQAGKLFRVPSRGGSPELWLDPRLEGKVAVNPTFLRPGDTSDKLLYVEGSSPADAEIFSYDRPPEKKEMLVSGHSPIYASSGHILYQNVDPPGVWALPFSAATMRATGDPFPVSQNGSWPSVALDGTLVYLEGPAFSGLEQLVWRDRQGNKLGTIGQPQTNMTYPALSPDGKRVAVVGLEGSNRDIWIHEVDRPVKTRFTTHQEYDGAPVWSPAGAQIVFSSGRTNKRDLYLKRADGAGDASLLLSNPELAQYVTGWSRDGEYLICWRRPQPQANLPGDIFYLKRKQDGSGYEDLPFLETPFDERTPQLSPNGRYLAYASDESGQLEVYIQSFPQGGEKQRISVNRGLAPRWRSDGQELFYVEGNTLMAVQVSASPSLTIDQPVRLFSSRRLGGFLNYDVTPDGERFVVAEQLEAESVDEAPPRIRVVQNWHAEFEEEGQQPAP